MSLSDHKTYISIGLFTLYKFRGGAIFLSTSQTIPCGRSIIFYFDSLIYVENWTLEGVTWKKITSLMRREGERGRKRENVTSYQCLGNALVAKDNFPGL